MAQAFIVSGTIWRIDDGTATEASVEQTGAKAPLVMVSRPVLA